MYRSSNDNEKQAEIPYKKITSLKSVNKKLKVLLSVGGEHFKIIFNKGSTESSGFDSFIKLIIFQIIAD